MGIPATEYAVPGPTRNPALSSSGGGTVDGDKGDIIVSGAGASWAFDPAVVTTFARTMLDDADAPAVRTTLGLGSVNNTADATKNVLTATKLLTARTINGVAFDGSANITVADATKEPSFAAGTTAQYRRGDKTWQILDKAAVGLANVDNTADAAKAVASAALLTTARTINGVSFNGSANITINAVDSTARLASSAVSTFMLTVLDDVDAPTARTTLGLGTLATQSGTFSGTHSGASSGTNTGDETSATVVSKISGQALTPASVAASGAVKSSSPLAGVGYAAGAGSSVIQVTSKSTPVTINALSGYITLTADALGAGGIVNVVVNNSSVANTDDIILNLQSGASNGANYRYWIIGIDPGTFYMAVENRSGGTLSEAIRFSFAIIKGVTS